jgi:hypothetical protein
MPRRERKRKQWICSPDELETLSLPALPRIDLIVVRAEAVNPSKCQVRIHLFDAADVELKDGEAHFKEGASKLYYFKNGKWAACRTTRDWHEQRSTRVQVIQESQAILEEHGTMTLRHLYYLLVSAGVIGNCKDDYVIVSNAIVDARETGAIDDDKIEDGSRSVTLNSGYSNVASFLNPAAYYTNPWKTQGVHVELWFEKAAIMSVVDSIGRDYKVTMRPFKGQASRSYCARIAEDFELIDKPIIVFYCGDHDPSGYCIPQSAEERVREILYQRFEGRSAGFTVERKAFNRDDFEAHPELNAFDAKETDSNYEKFVAEYGTDCAELDALPPEVLRNRLIDAVKGCIYDQDAWDAWAAQDAQERTRLQTVIDNWEG